jgi:sugar phosphate isomerase/epimerase
MRLGVCTKIANLQTVIKAGYDYIEFNLKWIAELSEEEFARVKETMDASPIKAEATNGFFAPDFPIVGPAVDYERITAYCENALSRAAALGVKVAVLGSGGARNIPEGFDPVEAEGQFIKVLRICGDVAAHHGITVAIEPLQKKETNFINTVAEGLAICNKAAHPAVKCLADYYHVLASGEGFDAIETADGLLIHTHIATRNRTMPATAEDKALCKEFADALKKCGYNARLSLEGRFGEDFTDAIQRALPILKEITQ